MTLYHAIQTATGQRQRTATTQAAVEPLSADETLVIIANRTAEPTDMAWDAATLDYVPLPPPVPDCTCSVLEFKARFTTAERIAIERATESHADADVRATLRMIEKDLSDVSEKRVDRGDARTQQGVGFLASVGLIAPSRVAEIIGADALGV